MRTIRNGDLYRGLSSDNADEMFIVTGCDPEHPDMVVGVVINSRCTIVGARLGDQHSFDAWLTGGLGELVCGAEQCE